MTDAETVWIALDGGSSTRQTYHTRECTHCPAPDRRTERDRATLESWGYSECAYCAGTREPVTTNQRSLRARLNDADDPIQELASDGDDHTPHRRVASEVADD